MKLKVYTIALSVLGLALILAAARAPVLFVNGTASMPKGIYFFVGNRAPKVGDVVLIRMTETLRNFAFKYHWLSKDVPLLKRVVALDGSEVCKEKSILKIDGRSVAPIFETDGEGEPLPQLRGCALVPPDMFFALGDNATSFDSRYFGALSNSLIIGQLKLIYRF